MAPIHRSPEPTFRFVTAGFLLLGLFSTFPLVSAAEDHLTREEAQKKLDETSHKLQSSRAQEQGLAQDIAALAEARAKLNTELIEAGKQVQASEAKLSETEAKLSELTDQVTVIRNSITERKETIVKMLSAMQRIGRTPPPALVTRRDDALAVVRSAMLLAQVFPELKYQADNLSQELDGLVKLETGIREQRDTEKRENDRLAGERGRIDKLLEEKKAKLAQSQAELAATRQAAERQAVEET
jgi:septal ring factor EnvC (AmiA/AmiB activator)